MIAKSITSPRRYDLDWLRAFAILTVFIYHSTRFFTPEDWHVKNLTTYGWVDGFENILEIWMMPIIFAISGASLFYALGKGGFGKFLKDKLLRLGLPLVVGVFTHASLQVYLERITHGQFTGSYFQFLPHYFDGFYTDASSSGNFAWAGMHLWYLLFLFIYSLAFFPLFRWLKGAGQGVLRKTGDFLARPGAALLLALLPALLEAFLNDTWWGETAPGGWGIGVYIGFFLSGFLIISHDRLQESLRRLRWIYLAIGLVGMILFLLLTYEVIRFKTMALGEPLGQVIDNPIASLASWSLILAFLGFAGQHLSFSRPFLKYANEAVLPFYILHQTVLLCVGYFVVRMAIPDLAKWLIISSSSLIIIMALYEFLVRRWNVLRILFGMRALPRAVEAEEAAQITVRAV